MDCWDVGGRANGVQWLKPFPRAGLAQTWSERLEADFAAGLPFDLSAKRFAAAQVPAGPTMPSVFDLTEDYYHQHPEWEPKTKMAAARSFNRARHLLLAPKTEPARDALQAVDDYLDNASFLPEHMAGQLTESGRRRGAETDRQPRHVNCQWRASYNCHFALLAEGSPSSARFEGLPGGAAIAPTSPGDRRQKDLQRLQEPVTAAGEGRDHLLVRDRGDVRSASQTGVEVGDGGQRDVAHPELPGEHYLWVLGHPDDIGTHPLEPL
jgi:hypothetical protein